MEVDDRSLTLAHLIAISCGQGVDKRVA